MALMPFSCVCLNIDCEIRSVKCLRFEKKYWICKHFVFCLHVWFIAEREIEEFSHVCLSLMFLIFFKKRKFQGQGRRRWRCARENVKISSEFTLWHFESLRKLKVGKFLKIFCGSFQDTLKVFLECSFQKWCKSLNNFQVFLNFSIFSWNFQLKPIKAYD